MTTISITPKSNSNKVSYNKASDTFNGSEKDIPFDTSYTIENSETKKSEVFDFVNSTGPEFDPNTKWIYKSLVGRTLVISNDSDITKKNAQSYLEHKCK
jgi:hypothetical protein